MPAGFVSQLLKLKVTLSNIKGWKWEGTSLWYDCVCFIDVEGEEGAVVPLRQTCHATSATVVFGQPRTQSMNPENTPATNPRQQEPEQVAVAQEQASLAQELERC